MLAQTCSLKEDAFYKENKLQALKYTANWLVM